MSVVWSPFELADGSNGAVPSGVTVDIWDGTGPWPPSVDQVSLYVLPYMAGPAVLEPLSQMTRLRVLQTLTAGYEDLLAVRPSGVTLCNAPGVHDSSTAELAVSLMLASLRGLPEFVRAAQEQLWAPQRRPAVADRSVLILGFGGVGRAVARRLAGFEVTITPVASTARLEPDGATVHGVGSLPELLPRADVVVVCVPLTEATRGLVDAGFLARLPDGALLVNVSRGPVVSTPALLAELQTGRLTAALDVSDPEPLPPGHPLWEAPGLLLSPHVGGNTTAFVPRARRFLHDQLARYATGAPLLGVVAS